MTKTIFTLFLALSSSIGYAQVTLPKIFSDHMVLQRDLDIPVWGSASPGIEVTVHLGSSRIRTSAGTDGNWTVRLPQMRAGGPYELSVFEGENTDPIIVHKDVLIGDVWLASGQSNMEWQVQQSMNAEEEIKNANYPKIRLFQVPHAKKLEPQEDVIGGSWKVCDSSTVKDFSAVAYYFARKLREELDSVPIGIVQSTWGGTPVEAWTSREMLLSSEITKEQILQNDTVTEKHFVQDSLDLILFREIVYNPQNNTDQTVPKRKFDDSDWSALTMPSTFKDWNMPFYEGIFWMRKSIDIPKSMKGKELTIHLGHPEMNYSLYFNGKEIAKNVWNAAETHHYTIPAELVKTGKNVVAVRVAVLWGGGGFNPPAENMYITDGADRIRLAGQWKYNKDLEPSVPTIKNYHKFPTYLYNGMIAPVLPYGIRGFIWYQGEDNVGAAEDYQKLFPMLISDWRIRWKQGYLPFLFVQLANFMKQQPEPTESDWAELREAQTMTLAQPNTGMATIIDIGEADDIHPKNKQEVGRRLALLAEELVYGKDVQAYGPLFQDFKVEDDKVRIKFNETGSGLTTRGNGPLKGFAVAGKDKKFYWADAKIVGKEVIVSSEKVEKPVAVRYAWADNPEANLINKEGLPAVPFRTDKWEKEE